MNDKNKKGMTQREKDRRLKQSSRDKAYAAVEDKKPWEKKKY